MSIEDILFSELLFMEVQEGYPVAFAYLIVKALIVLLTVGCIVVSILLFFRYRKSEREPNYASLTGLDTAKRILMENGLDRVVVTTNFSLLFGNGYSYLFRKVRLRPGAYWNNNLVGLALGGQNATLAVMHRKKDPDMKNRIWLTILSNIGPFAFIPLVVVGLVFDLLIYNGEGYMPLVVVCLGLLFYFLAALAAQFTLRSELKGQYLTRELFEREGLATQEEQEKIDSLFLIYNIIHISSTAFAVFKFVDYLLQIFVKIAAIY